MEFSAVSLDILHTLSILFGRPSLCPSDLINIQLPGYKISLISARVNLATLHLFFIKCNVMHLLISKIIAWVSVLFDITTEFIQQIRKGAIVKYLRKLIVKYTDNECTIIV